MKENTFKLIELLNGGYSVNQICNIMNISNKQLFTYLTNLKNKGFMYKRNYYSNGVITYSPIKNFSNLKKFYSGIGSSIITPHELYDFRCVVISDLHFGNSMERFDLIKDVFDYCVSNDIHIILCCGDMIDGSFSKYDQDIDNVYLQIEHFIKDYPFSKNILTFGVAGDHDADALFTGHQNIIEALKNYRHDIVINNFNNAFVNIKNDSVQLFHHIFCGSLFKANAPIILHGHSHKYSSVVRDGILNITVPSLSSINESLPTMVDMTLHFYKGYIENVNLKQIYFESRPIVLSEIDYKLDRKLDRKPIMHENRLIDEEEIILRKVK